MKQFGLIGHPLEHSFSRDYFKNKFTRENLDCCYKNFDLDNIQDFKQLLQDNPEVCGLNVTIPYKQQIINYLYKLDIVAQSVGAVNTIKFENGNLIGYNTDVIGFEILLNSTIKNRQIEHALVLGSGGASKAVAFVLRKRNIAFSIVSRTNKGDLTYNKIDKSVIDNNKLIINTTPLGMFPNVETKPTLPYSILTNNHICIDLVYNPLETDFLKLAKQQNAIVANGMEMLVAQAEASWKIWNTKL